MDKSREKGRMITTLSFTRMKVGAGRKDDV